MNQARRTLGLLEPFLGLVFIFLVFVIYDAAFIDGENFIPPGPVTAFLDWFGNGAEILENLGLEKFAALVSWANLKQISSQTTIIAIGGLGMTIIIIAGGIDLSPGSTIALTTVVIALALRGIDLPFLSEEPLRFSPAFALLAGVLIGGIVGLVNGLIISGLRVVPFIVTLGTMSAVRGLAKLLSSEQKVNAPQATWINELLHFSRAKDAPWWQFPQGFFLMLILALILFILLRFTVFGRHVFAIGSNESTALLCGVRVRTQKVLIYAFAGLFVGVAGVLEFSALNSGDPSTAVGRELDIIAAVVIGGASLSGGKGSVLGTVIGALVIGVLRNGCVLFEVRNPWQEVVIGGIIVAAAALDRLRSRGDEI